MPIPLTNSDYAWFIEEVNKVFANMRRSLTRISGTWRAQITGQTVSESVLQSRITDAITKQKMKLDALASFILETAKWNELKKVLGRRGGDSDAQIETDVVAWATLINQLDTMPKTTYAEQLAVCDLIDLEIEAPLIPVWDVGLE